MHTLRMYKILVVFINVLLFAAICHAQINEGNDSAKDVIAPPTKLSDYHEKNKNFEPITDAYTPIIFKENHQLKESIDSVKNTEEFWYVKAAENGTLFKKEEQTKAPGAYSFLLAMSSIVWWILVGIFIIAIVYFLLSNKINIFRKSAASNSSGDEMSYDEENIFELPYQRLLQKAYDEKNYRLVVRLLYLQTLKILSEKSLIKYQAGLTNNIYLSQLYNSKYYDLFFKITRYYEYVWYGEFPIEAVMFQKIEQDFKKMMSDA